MAASLKRGVYGQEWSIEVHSAPREVLVLPAAGEMGGALVSLMLESPIPGPLRLVVGLPIGRELRQGRDYCPSLGYSRRTQSPAEPGRRADRDFWRDPPGQQPVEVLEGGPELDRRVRGITRGLRHFALRRDFPRAREQPVPLGPPGGLGLGVKGEPAGEDFAGPVAKPFGEAAAAIVVPPERGFGGRAYSAFDEIAPGQIRLQVRGEGPDSGQVERHHHRPSFPRRAAARTGFRPYQDRLGLASRRDRCPSD